MAKKSPNRIKQILSRTSMIKIGIVAVTALTVVASGAFWLSGQQNSAEQQKGVDKATTLKTSELSQASDVMAVTDDAPATSAAQPSTSSNSAQKTSTPAKTYPTSSVQTPLEPAPNPALTTISTYLSEAAGFTSDPAYYKDYNISWWLNLGAKSPEGYIVSWTVDHAANFNGQETLPSTPTATFRLSTHRGYTYNVTVCEKKGSGCGVKSDVVRIQSPS